MSLALTFKERQKKLRQLAAAFAERQQNLLNKTVAKGLRITFEVAQRFDGLMITVGYNIKANNLAGTAIPLTISRADALFKLHYLQMFKLDALNTGLVLVSSRCTLLRHNKQTGEDEKLARYETDTGLHHETPYLEHHAHFAAEVSVEDLIKEGRGKENPEKLHWPTATGLMLAHLVRFCCDENMVDKHENWEAAVTEELHLCQEQLQRELILADLGNAQKVLDEAGRTGLLSA